MKSPSTNSPAPIIGVHVDLKGMNFKPAYIPEYLSDLASQGVNTILLEYEDVFPFTGLDLAHDLAVRWSADTLRRFRAVAARDGIEIIPLQQCLGHLEYLLSWKRYRNLAEDPAHPSTIRLRESRAVGLVAGMLEQVIAAHPESRYVHLGLDEAHGLTQAARRLRAEPLDLFVEHLRTLLAIVEGHGRKAMIWSDMAEQHFRPGALDEFKGRLVLVPWHYFQVGDLSPFAPLGGKQRVSRSWLDTPDHPAAPAIGPETQFVEDAPRLLRRVLSPYRRGRMFQPLLEVDLWTKQGMEVVGASALRFTRNGSVLPLYNQQFSNVRGWAAAVRRAGQLGQIGTSWARATSWSPPNHCIDLQWPIVTEMARAMGAKPKPFWPGIAPTTVDRIFKALGRCREDWAIEEHIAAEMETLAPRLKAHRFEWHSVILMARTMALQRRATAEVARMETYHADNRPVDSEWERRLRAQTGMLGELRRMKRRVRAHFARRFHGAAFDEWLRHLFDLHVERLEAARAQCRERRRESRQRYAGTGHRTIVTRQEKSLMRADGR